MNIVKIDRDVEIEHLFFLGDLFDLLGDTREKKTQDVKEFRIYSGMKHIKLYEDNERELLTQMQGLTLAPKPLGFWISMVTYSEGTVATTGVGIVAKDLRTVAELLFGFFNLEDYWDELVENNRTWKDIQDIIGEFDEALGDYNQTSDYKFWELEPRTSDHNAEEIEEVDLMNPIESVELGRRMFKNFDSELKRLRVGI